MLDGNGRIVSTREPNPKPSPRFSLIRGSTECAWAKRVDISNRLAAQLDELASEEPAVDDFRREPLHAAKYASLLGGRLYTGPAFTFPDMIASRGEVTPIEDVAALTQNFKGWLPNEIPACSPILGISENGHAISVCFCARKSSLAAEAGVEGCTIPWSGTGSTGDGRLGSGHSGIESSSALQHLVVQRAVSGRRSQVGPEAVRQRLEPVRLSIVRRLSNKRLKLSARVN